MKMWTERLCRALNISHAQHIAIFDMLHITVGVSALCADEQKGC